MRPRATWLRTVVPCSISGKEMSSTYSACPVTFFRPSLRGADLPMGWLVDCALAKMRYFTT